MQWEKKKKKDWQPYEGRDNVAILLLNPLPLELRGRLKCKLNSE